MFLTQSNYVGFAVAFVIYTSAFVLHIELVNKFCWNIPFRISCVFLQFANFIRLSKMHEFAYFMNTFTSCMYIWFFLRNMSSNILQLLFFIALINLGYRYLTFHRLRFYAYYDYIKLMISKGFNLWSKDIKYLFLIGIYD